MELDFSRLDTLRTGSRDATGRTKTEPAIKNTTEHENGSEGLSGASERVSLVKLDREREDRARLLEAYRQIQDNIKASGELRTGILKGAKAGEPVVSLLLSAVKCISLMTGDTVFSRQVEEDLIAIYGEGLLEPEPLQIQLSGVEERLEKLQNSLTRAGIAPDDRQRIERAIQSHQQKRGELLGLLGRA